MKISLSKKAHRLAGRLQRLKQKRRKRKNELKDIGPAVRGHLTEFDRELILRKAGRRCHICGGKIKEAWHADHVLAHSVGGKSTIENYLRPISSVIITGGTTRQMSSNTSSRLAYGHVLR